MKRSWPKRTKELKKRTTSFDEQPSSDLFRLLSFLSANHGPGHLEKIYENALVHCLRKQGLRVEQQVPLQVFDEDGTLLGDFLADAVVEGVLLLELKAVRSVLPEHIAQLLGYLKSARMEHGVLLNFGAQKFHIKMYGMSNARNAADS